MLKTLVKPGEYRDSVALMLIARELTALPGIASVSVVMGSPANKALLQQAGLLTREAEAAGPNDLVIAVAGQDEASTGRALQKAELLLAQKAAAQPTAPGAGALAVRSVRSAVRSAPEANVAMISVPGQYAAAQAWDALHAGLHVLLFSDHVELADELALKQYARDHGLLLMGPGAGTAIINGVGLGFANAVPRGPVGVVAAAGTGLQEVTTLVAKAGLGITQGIGVGGRDVSDAVGGIMMLEALKALQSDPATQVLLVVSKLPAPAVVDRICKQAQASAKPTVLAFMRAADGPRAALESNAGEEGPWFASDLHEAAALAAALARGSSIDAARTKLAQEDASIRARARRLRHKLSARQRYVRGLYSGGTLCEEGLRLWQPMLGEVWSNAPLDPRFKLEGNKSRRHTAVDLGEEEFTIGRPHPMIDNTLRIQRLMQEARDPGVGVIVLDVVLGYGAHPDPAAELGPAISEAKQLARTRGRELLVVTSVTGTEQDPQGLGRQTAALEHAGAIVMGSNAAAVRLAGEILGQAAV